MRVSKVLKVDTFVLPFAGAVTRNSPANTVLPALLQSFGVAILKGGRYGTKEYISGGDVTCRSHYEKTMRQPICNGEYLLKWGGKIAAILAQLRSRIAKVKVN